jgi:mono/diheme cytochrome c family protein
MLDNNLTTSMKKVNFRILPSQLSLLLLALMLAFSTTTFSQADPVAGKALFNANCAACHKL